MAEHAICFLHLPKAGGTSVRSRFLAAFEPNSVSPTVEGLPHERDPSAWSTYGRYDFVSGHCGYEVYRDLGSRYHLVTNFRHPVARIVSLYDYWHNNTTKAQVRRIGKLNGPALARRMSFTEFVNSDEEALKLYLRNAHARQLLKTPWEYWQLVPADYLKLRRQIRRMHWYYVVEYKNLSEAWFQIRFPWLSAVELRSENVTRYKWRAKTKPTQADIETILRHNRYDVAIYEYAVHLLQARLRRPSFPLRNALDAAGGPALRIAQTRFNVPAE